MTATPARVGTGLAAGVVAGLAAAWLMGQFHALAFRVPGLSPPSAEGKDSTVKTAAAISEGVFDHRLSPDEEKTAASAVHYAFGAGVGGLYGAAVEIAPVVSRAGGLPFGVTVWLGAHVIMVPALGLAPPITRSSTPFEAVELAAHLVYGGATELLRRLLRGRRDRRASLGARSEPTAARGALPGRLPGVKW
jgi:putative membrane protein